MIFLNGLLALGALAFTVPLAIHLLFRNRFEIVDWGAMRFLQSVVRVNRRRMQLRNLLLLLLRCAIPILLALCLARPVLTRWQTLPGDEPVTLVLALDTSYSLAARVDPSSRRFDRLIATAQEIVSNLPRGSDVMLATSMNVGRDEPASEFRGDPQSALTALQTLRLGGAPLAIDSLLSESLRKISGATTERRQIVLLTDDLASDFSQSQLDSFASVGQRRAAQSPAPAIAWIDSWQPVRSESNNRRITRLEPMQSTSVPGQSVSWTVEARIDGEAPPAAAVLDIRIDGETLQPLPLSFRHGIARTTFQTEFTAAGRHAIEVALPAEDDFAPDDRVRADYMVMPAMDVWLVDGNPSDKPLQSDTAFLAIALSPFSLAGEKAVDLFRTSSVEARQLGSIKNDPPSIVVLADVGALRREAAQWLRDFVELQGGTLVVFAGPSTDPEWLDKQLLATDSRSMLPMRYGDVKAMEQNQTAVKIDESRLTYPPLASFLREAKGTLSAVEIASYLTMQPHAADVQANIIMELENGDPLIAVRELGKGRVMQVATTANDRWTSLPRRLAFVPLMQRLFMHLATGETRPITPTAGEPILIPVDWMFNRQRSPSSSKASDAKAAAAEAAPGDRCRVVTPSGESYDLPIAAGQVSFGRTDAAGIYRFESGNEQTMHSAYSAVNVPEADLKRAPADAAVRSDAAARIGATRYQSASAYQDDDSARRFGRGVWRYLLLALLAAMVAEPLLQQRGAKVIS